MEKVIGNGAIALRFAKYSNQDNYLIFTGIHDSEVRDERIFLAEEDEIRRQVEKNSQLKFVYLSSCSVLDSLGNRSPYSSHKAKMENLISSIAKSYLIFRLPNLIGQTDVQSGLVNYLTKNILTGTPFDIWKNAGRNFVDIDDAYQIMHHVLHNHSYSNTVINIASSKTTTIQEAVNALELLLKRKANYRLVDRGESNNIDISETLSIIELLKIQFDSNYFTKAIEKHWNQQLATKQLGNASCKPLID